MAAARPAGGVPLFHWRVMSITVPVIRNARTEITAAEPAVWSIYDPASDTYCRARPVACWTTVDGDKREDWLEAHSDVSRSAGRQYKLTAKYVPGSGEWELQGREVIN